MKFLSPIDDGMYLEIPSHIHPTTAALPSAWYYAGGIQYGNSISVTSGISANRLYGFIQGFKKTVILDRLAVKISTAAPSGNGRLGIYKVNKNLEPENLIVESPEFSLTTTGAKTLPVSVELIPGDYMFTAIFGNTVTLSTIFASNNLMPYGYDDTLTAGRNYIYTNKSYGALPDPFPMGSPVFAAIGIFILFRRSS